MTGAEFDLATASAGRGAGRVALYSAGTIAGTDMSHVPGAIGGAAAVIDSGVEAPWSVVVRAPGGSALRRLKVDGRQWPASAGVAVIPAGTHKLAWSTGDAAGPGLLRFTGELATASVSGSQMTLRYDSRAVAYAVVDRRPLATASVPNPGGGFSVRLPPGRHDVTLTFAATRHSDGSRSGLLIAGVAVLLGAVGGVYLFARFRHR
jgi:hypothetical protein